MNIWFIFLKVNWAKIDVTHFYFKDTYYFKYANKSKYNHLFWWWYHRATLKSYYHWVQLFVKQLIYSLFFVNLLFWTSCKFFIMNMSSSLNNVWFMSGCFSKWHLIAASKLIIGFDVVKLYYFSSWRYDSS